MFRDDGEVFLFGTAITAPLNSYNKNGDDLAPNRAGGRIVANRGPYTAWGCCCKLGVAVRPRDGGEGL
jgi:hypothetical protein